MAYSLDHLEGMSERTPARARKAAIKATASKAKETTYFLGLCATLQITATAEKIAPPKISLVSPDESTGLSMRNILAALYLGSIADESAVASEILAINRYTSPSIARAVSNNR